jgi:hypothetical protein
VIKLGEGRVNEGLLVARADARGVVGIKLPIQPVIAEHYPLLRMRFAEVPEKSLVTAAWRSSLDLPEEKRVRTGDIGSSDFWLYLAGNTHWDGTIEELKLVLRGKQGDRFLIESISLEPLSFKGLALSNRFDWLSGETWTQKSANFHKVVPAGRGPLNLLSVVALFLFTAILAYALWRLASGRSFDLRVAGAVVVIGWLLLDGLWLGRLVKQADATRAQFAGKSAEQKLLDGPDAGLYRLISEVRGLLAPEEEVRLFVATSGDYRGMRTAYYLYPYNVYWQRKGPEVPDPRYLRSGDYIVLVPPSELEIDHQRSALVLPDSNLVEVEPLLVRETGMLLKVR